MEHGGDLAQAMAAHGGSISDWLDLSTGINPHAWPIPPALREEGRARLPSASDVSALLDAARRAYRVPGHCAIVAAPGTQALIQWLPRLAPPGAVAIVGPTYSEHGRAWRDGGFAVADIEDASDKTAARHMVLVNPNNPDGRVVPPADLLRLARRQGERGGWLVVDESFADVAPDASVVPLLTDEPAIVLRSFGKFYGLAGLRLGFAVARRPIADSIARALGPWAVSGPALAIGRAALADDGWAEATRRRLKREADAMDLVLEGAGFRVVGGTSLFRLARMRDAVEAHTRLARSRIWVRRFANRPALLRFGLPSNEADLGRLAAALTGIE